jgi:tripartite-type tricarboxylate transporter receptor subunit TctC
VLLLADSRKRLADEGAEPQPNSPKEFTEFVNSDVAKWLRLAQQTGIKLGAS